MAFNELQKIIINKLTKAQYDSAVANGELTAEQLEQEVFVYTDDQHVSAAEKAAWNNKSNFSGDYNDLANKPSIPDVSNLETKADANSKLVEAKAYADTKVADLVGSAPETLNTLQEVAEAIQEHEDVAEALNNAIGNKVDKEAGKSLVANDEIEKLASVEANANYYVLPGDVVQDSAYVHTDNNYSADEKAKVEANANARHSHSNKAVLDGTTASFTEELKAKLEGINVPTVITRIWG